MRRQEYTTLDRLRVRQRIHLLHSDPPDNVEVTTLATAPVTRGSSVLDVGCGTGSFLALLAQSRTSHLLVGVDISEAAVTNVASRGVAALRADVAALPFARDAFDFVFARHMLDHVADVPAAVDECRRVLKVQGRFVAVINHPYQAPVLGRLITEIVTANGIHSQREPAVNSENLRGFMKDSFGNVWKKDVTGSLVFNDAGILIEYATALLSFYGVSASDPPHHAITAQISQKIHEFFQEPDSVWRDPKGYSVCVSVKR
jgi:SAM-dependent methyltransferase